MSYQDIFYFGQLIKNKIKMSMNKLINWHLWKCGWFAVHNLVSFPLFNISHIPLGLSGKYCRLYSLVSDQDLSHQSHWQVTCYMQQSVSFDRSGEPTGAPISSRMHVTIHYHSFPFLYNIMTYTLLWLLAFQIIGNWLNSRQACSTLNTQLPVLVFMSVRWI